jgi:hypothetical protein
MTGEALAAEGTRLTRGKKYIRIPEIATARR